MQERISAELASAARREALAIKLAGEERVAAEEVLKTRLVRGSLPGSAVARGA